jgi:hydrogenase maturation factor HypF (carbamoyltransferase family)
VEIKASGDPSVLEIFISELREGPLLARVTDVQIGEISQQFQQDFEIHEDGE